LFGEYIFAVVIAVQILLPVENVNYVTRSVQNQAFL